MHSTIVQLCKNKNGAEVLHRVRRQKQTEICIKYQQIIWRQQAFFSLYPFSRYIAQIKLVSLSSTS